MLVWFAAIACSGSRDRARALKSSPRSTRGTRSRSPRSTASFGFSILGAVVLAVTGVEALYADLSHFGRGPIARLVRAGFSGAGRSTISGKARLSRPHALDNPFYALTPGWTLVPMVLLATVATVIASQALISGAFTLAEQAIRSTSGRA